MQRTTEGPQRCVTLPTTPATREREVDHSEETPCSPSKSVAITLHRLSRTTKRWRGFYTKAPARPSSSQQEEKVMPHRHGMRREHPAAYHHHTLCIQTRCPRQQPPRMQRETIQAQWGFAVQRPPLEAGRGRSMGRVQGWAPRTTVQTRTQITTGRDISGYIIPTTTCCSRWPERRTAEG